MREIRIRYVLTQDNDIKLITLDLDMVERSNEIFNLGLQGWKIKDRNLFTGLHDKNGKEIYEGDIFDVDIGNRIVKVAWFESQACFDTEVVKLIDKNWPYFVALQNNHWSYRCEVIGNIYENPELLINN